MKNIFLKIFLILISFSTVSCSETEELYYDGDNFLHFNKGVAKDGFVTVGTTQADYVIDYGVLKSVTGNHQVTLVLDTSVSTAVEGVDFQILNKNDELSSGEVGGQFTVRVLEANATQTPKIAVFKLKSSTIQNAIFDQSFTLKTSLTCPVSYFVGDFDNTQGWWAAPSGPYTIEESTTNANQLLVKDFWDAGIDLVLNYNPVTYVVTVPDQNTGYFVSTYNGYIWAKQSTDATQISTFNPCTREMNLYINYYIPNVGSYGNKLEKFVGL